ncbi:MAG: AAA family ATPase [Bacteroidaceae bacterium]|nr:AAA family ATPase [Bacteroidaceae bacterium]
MQQTEIIKSVRFVLCQKDEQYLYVVPAKGGDVWRMDYHVNSQTEEAANLLTEGMQLNGLLCQFDNEQQNVLVDMIVVEPDLMIDVTALCGCMKTYGDSAMNYLVNRIRPDEQTQYILLGNVAGQFLDDCVNNPDITYLESIRHAFRQNILGFTTCDGVDAAFFKECERQFRNIQLIVNQMHADPNFMGMEAGVQLEPSFFCEAMGIQGRFDFLQVDYKNLIELKSGKWDTFLQTAKREHLAQMLLYKEILYYNLDISQQNIRGYLLYSKYPLLIEQRSNQTTIRQLMQLRNLIVMMERQLKEGGASHFLCHLQAEDLNVNHVGGKLWTNYNLPELQEVLRPLQQMDSLTADYFYTFFTFVAREQYLQKVADSSQSDRAMSNLWNVDAETKWQNGDIVYNLRPIHVELSQIEMQLPDEGFPFREGDSVVLYRRENEGDTAVNRQVFRCTVGTYDTHHVVLHLKNPQHNPRLFAPSNRFAIEADYIDSSMRAQYHGLYALLTAPADRRELLLCRRKPMVDKTLHLKGHYLTKEIDRIVLKAKQAQDYFLLVGPPGTGKTSVALRSMVEEFRQEGKSLLLLAYTNRAVDEICEMLADIDYIRIGREQTCAPQFRSHLINYMVGDDVRRDTVRQMIDVANILVATVSAMTSARYLFGLKRFDVAIFDEASQILEPQILPLLCHHVNGTLSIRKFIMIGDHKQLPAVVVQDAKQSEVHSKQLRRIGLRNCRNSLFERLFTVCARQPAIVATLTHQGRMHPEIADFVSQLFYGGKLHIVGLPHQKALLDYLMYDDDEQLVATHRVAFIDVPIPPPDECQFKVNKLEAEKIATLVRSLISVAEKNSQPFDPVTQLGIIVPFRRQVAAVRCALHDIGIAESSSIMIDTVERYQGSQRDVILFGTTITSASQLEILSNLVELDDCVIDRKLNVALTRARKQLFIFGNRQLLSQHVLYRQLIDYIERLSKAKNHK